MVPPIKLAFAGGREGRSGSRLAGSSLVSESTSIGWIASFDMELTEEAGEGDTTFCEGAVCSCADPASEEPARAIPDTRANQNRFIAIPISELFDAIVRCQLSS